MLQFVLVALLATSTLAAPSASVQWPDIFEPCATSRPDFEDCAKRNLQTAVTNFSAGVPELDIPPFDPIFVPVVLVDYKQENAEGKMIVRNSKVHGLKDGEILGFRSNFVDPSNLLIEVDLRFPSLFVEGEYKAQGKIVGFPLGGKGVYNISMSDVSATCQVQGDLVTIAGDRYLKVRHVNMLPEVGDMKTYASNLFTGSDELNNAALRFINQYWPAFYKELLPFAAEGWDVFLRGVLNKLFLQVPFDTIFPQN
jgi:hypothetical protein